MARTASSSDEHGASARRSAPTGCPARSSVADTTLLDLLPQPAFVVAVDGDDVFRFVYANARVPRAARRRPTRPTGDLRRVVPADVLVAHIRAFARAAREHRAVSFEAEWGGAARRRRVAVDVTPIVDDDGACRQLVGAAHDVTEHRRIEAELAHRTRHDPLTELPNRVMLVEWLAGRARRDAPTTASVGLVLLDIDHFKIVNDSLGLEAGDELLAVDGAPRRARAARRRPARAPRRRRARGRLPRRAPASTTC